MSSIKCPGCGLVNFATAQSCKRCGTPLTGNSSAPPDSASTQAPPGSNDQPFVSHFSATRDGDLLLLTEDSVLPDRCVRCNAPTTRQLKRRLNWSTGSVSWTSAITVLLGVIVYSVSHETATIYIGLCDRHHNRRLLGMVLGGGLIALGLVMGLVTVFNSDFQLLAYGGIALVVGSFIAVLLTSTVSAKRIERPYIWLKGVNKDYLKSL